MTWALTADAAIAAYLLLLAVLDQRTGRLPNRWLAPLLVVAVAAVCADPVAGLAAAAAAIPYTAGFLAHRCGGGDVKLAAGCGAVLGAPASALLAVLVAALLTLVTCLLVRRSAVPHGPALVVATLTAGALTLVSDL